MPEIEPTEAQLATIGRERAWWLSLLNRVHDGDRDEAMTTVRKMVEMHERRRTT